MVIIKIIYSIYNNNLKLLYLKNLNRYVSSITGKKNLILILDVSGSMSGRMSKAKDAA